MATHEVRVGPVPSFVPLGPLLGPGHWKASEAGHWEATLERAAAADVQARLRKLVLDGRAVMVEVRPALPRTAVRHARTEDARRRRETTPGFERAGTRVDDEGRWSLTPEALALELGRRAQGRTVLDAGCGVGGNTIGFARAGSHVVAVERDPTRLRHARHNAAVYGVAKAITWRAGDAVAALAEVDTEIVFVDPPWGVDWSRPGVGRSSFPLLDAALSGRRPHAELWAKLPPSFDTRTTADASVEPMFGLAQGDVRRIKFLWLRWGGEPVVPPL